MQEQFDIQNIRYRIKKTESEISGGIRGLLFACIAFRGYNVIMNEELNLSIIYHSILLMVISLYLIYDSFNINKYLEHKNYLNLYYFVQTVRLDIGIPAFSDKLKECMTYDNINYIISIMTDIANVPSYKFTYDEINNYSKKSEKLIKTASENLIKLFKPKIDIIKQRKSKFQKKIKGKQETIYKMDKWTSIDVRSANWSALKWIGNENGIDLPKWSEYIKKYTDYEIFLKSKEMRQVIIGVACKKLKLFAIVTDCMHEILCESIILNKENPKIIAIDEAIYDYETDVKCNSDIKVSHNTALKSQYGVYVTNQFDKTIIKVPNIEIIGNYIINKISA